MEADILQAFSDILQNGVLKNFAYSQEDISVGVSF